MPYNTNHPEISADVHHSHMTEQATHVQHVQHAIVEVQHKVLFIIRTF